MLARGWLWCMATRCRSHEPCTAPILCVLWQFLRVDLPCFLYAHEHWHRSIRLLIMSTYQPVQVVSSTQETTPNLYPPHAAYHGTNSAMLFDTKPGEDTQVSRTPSPTPSEAKELESGAVDWKALLTGKFWFRKEWLCTSSSFFKAMLRSLNGSRVLCRASCNLGSLRTRHYLSHTDCPLVNTLHKMAIWVCPR